MPILENQRHELFAQAIVQGKSATEAYAEAGYSANRGNATRMNANESIQKRVLELQSRIVRNVVISREWVLERLVENANRAMQAMKASDDGEYKYEGSVANKSLELIGKELGMFIERAEVGTPGEFDGLNVEDKRGRSVNLLRQFGITRRTTVAGRS